MRFLKIVCTQSQKKLITKVEEQKYSSILSEMLYPNLGKNDNKRNILQFFAKKEKMHQIVVQIRWRGLQFTYENGINKKKSYALLSQIIRFLSTYGYIEVKKS